MNDLLKTVRDLVDPSLARTEADVPLREMHAARSIVTLSRSPDLVGFLRSTAEESDDAWSTVRGMAMVAAVGAELGRARNELWSSVVAFLWGPRIERAMLEPSPASSDEAVLAMTFGLAAKELVTVGTIASQEILLAKGPSRLGLRGLSVSNVSVAARLVRMVRLLTESERSGIPTNEALCAVHVRHARSDERVLAKVLSAATGVLLPGVHVRLLSGEEGSVTANGMFRPHESHDSSIERKIRFEEVVSISAPDGDDGDDVAAAVDPMLGESASHEVGVRGQFLFDVLFVAISKRRSGCVRAQSPGSAIFLQDGRPTVVQIAEPSRKLGKILVDLHRATEEDMEKRVVEAQSMGLKLGELLLGDELITEAELAQALAMQRQERLAVLARNARGPSWVFEPATHATHHEPILDASPIPTLVQMLRGSEDDAYWDKLRQEMDQRTGIFLGWPSVLELPDEKELRLALAIGVDEPKKRFGIRGERFVSLLGAFGAISGGRSSYLLGWEEEVLESASAFPRSLPSRPKIRRRTENPPKPRKSSMLPPNLADQEAVDRTLKALSHYRLADQALRVDDLETAINQAKVAVELEPEETDYRLLFAWIQSRREPEFCTEVIEVATACLRREPNQVRALLWRGHAKHDLGRTDEAVDDYRRILVHKPQHEEARAALAKLGLTSRPP